MKRRILRSFFGYFVLLNILVNTVRTLNTDNTTKLRAYVSRMYTHAHSQIQANNTHTHAHIHSSGADRQWVTRFLLCTHLLVSLCSLFGCVCVSVSECICRSCVQCMPKCWLTFKLGGCLQNNSFLLVYYKVNIYISSCESAHTHTYIYVYNLESFPFRSCYTCWLQENTEVSLSACMHVCVCVCVHVCTSYTWSNTCWMFLNFFISIVCVSRFHCQCN